MFFSEECFVLLAIFLPVSFSFPRSTNPPLEKKNEKKIRYIGNDRSMLLVNCLFRAGGAAALMTNTKRGTGAKYVLEHCERTHWASTQEG